MSKINLCNSALGILGEASITSLDDPLNERSIQCKLHYEQVVRYLLARGRYSFAIARAVLPRDTSAPAFGFAYRHKKPTDPLYLALVEIAGYINCPFDFQIEGQYFLSNNENMSIRYISRVEEAQFTAEFNEAVIWLLASRIAMKFTGSKTTTDTTAAMADDAFRKSVDIDWKARPNRTVIRSPGRAAFL